jgi:hypothetical protein
MEKLTGYAIRDGGSWRAGSFQQRKTNPMGKARGKDDDATKSRPLIHSLLTSEVLRRAIIAA